VYVRTSPPTETVIGTLSTVSTGANPSITVKKQDGTTVAFYLSQSVRIFIDGSRAGIGDLVTLTITQGSVSELSAENVTETVEGVVVAAITGNPPILTIRTADNERYSYLVDPNVTVVKDGQSSTFDRLLSGDGVTVEVTGDKVTAIQAESLDLDIEGATLIVVRFTNPPQLVIDDGEGELTYPIDEDVDVERSGRDKTIADLRPGDEVDVRIREGYVTKIDATPVEEELEGTLRSVTLSATPEITIVGPSGSEHTYGVADDCRIRKGRSRLTLSDLKPGYLVELELESGMVTRIDVEALALLDDLKGTVEYVIEDADVFVISLESDPDTTREIHVDSDTIYVKEGDTVDFDDLDVDDRVIVVGTTASGIFRAHVVVVTSVSY